MYITCCRKLQLIEVEVDGIFDDLLALRISESLHGFIFILNYRKMFYKLLDGRETSLWINILQANLN